MSFFKEIQETQIFNQILLKARLKYKMKEKLLLCNNAKIRFVNVFESSRLRMNMLN
jgi:hypothetical protein